MRSVALLAKAPWPGLAKTRLARDARIGPERAARLADAFLRDTLRTLASLPAVERGLHFAPPEALDFFRALDPDARCVPQPEADLGARISSAVEREFAAGASCVLAIGADAPQLSAETFARAFELLEHEDLVLGPCIDGGYYLIGLRRPTPRLFEGLEWSSPRVLEQTRARARELGLATRELALDFDVDEPADLDRLRAWIARNGASRCPHSARALAALDAPPADGDAL